MLCPEFQNYTLAPQACYCTVGGQVNCCDKKKPIFPFYHRYCCLYIHICVWIKPTRYSMLLSKLKMCWEADLLSLDRASLVVSPCSLFARLS